MLDQIDMLTDIAEFETMMGLSNYLIKECEMILYNDNLIMEAESEINSTANTDTSKPTAFQKIKNVLKKVWNAIKSWFEKLRGKVEGLSSNKLKEKAKEKANAVATDLSAKLKVLGNRKLPNEPGYKADENVTESYYFAESNNNNNNNSNNNNNGNNNNNNNQQQTPPPPPPPDPILMFKAKNIISKQQAAVALYAIRFKSGRYKAHVDLKGFKKLCELTVTKLDALLAYLRKTIDSTQYKSSEVGKMGREMKRALTEITAKSNQIISNEDITDKKGNKGGKFGDDSFGIKLENFGRYYADVIDTMEKYRLKLYEYKKPFAEVSGTIDSYIFQSKRVGNAIDDRRAKKVIEQNTQNLSELVEASRLALEFISGFGALLDRVRDAIDYDLRLLTSVNTYTDGFGSFFKKLGYIKNQTKAAINTTRLA